MKLPSAAAVISLIYLRHYRIGWLNWPTGRTDSSLSGVNPLFVINNESGWYEGWIIWDINVRNVAAPRKDGHAQIGTITQADAAILQRLGIDHNLPGAFPFTIDGRAPHFPSASDHFPDAQANTVPIHVIMGCLQCPGAIGCPLLLGVQ
jgi:hypothetical protein